MEQGVDIEVEHQTLQALLKKEANLPALPTYLT